MIPRFANPHLLLQQTEITTRASLYDEEDTQPHREDTLLSELDGLIKSTLDDRPAAAPDRSKKRKLNDTSDVQTSDIIDFRLVSTSVAPRPISLIPKPRPEIKVREPACEDDEAEADARRRRALETAVDFAWLVSESRQPCVPRPNEARKLLHMVASDGTSLSRPLIVIERERTHNSKALHSAAGAVKPSPHEVTLKGDYCPIIPVLSNDSRRHSSKRKSRRRPKRARTND